MGAEVQAFLRSTSSAANSENSYFSLDWGMLMKPFMQATHYNLLNISNIYRNEQKSSLLETRSADQPHIVRNGVSTLSRPQPINGFKYILFVHHQMGVEEQAFVRSAGSAPNLENSCFSLDWVCFSSHSCPRHHIIYLMSFTFIAMSKNKICLKHD